MNSRKKLIYKINDEDDKTKVQLTKSSKKVSIFGANPVSAKIVVNLLFNFAPDEIVVFDEDQNQLDENFYGLIYFKFMYNNLKLKLVTDIKKTANSDICILCFQSNKGKEYTLEKMYEHILIYEQYVPEIVKYNPKTILIVSTFPYSILTYYCVKYSKFPDNRVLGLGTTAYTRIFRYMVANDLGVSSSEIHGWVIGYAHIKGDTEYLSMHCLPLWSTVAIGSVKLEDLINLSNERKYTRLCETFLRKTSAEIIMNKGYIIGEEVCAIVKAILTNSKVVFSTSCNIRGFNGINYTAYLGLPCVLNRNGYNINIKLRLLQTEKNELARAAKLVSEAHKIIHEKFTNYKKSKSLVHIKESPSLVSQ